MNAVRIKAEIEERSAKESGARKKRVSASAGVRRGYVRIGDADTGGKGRRNPPVGKSSRRRRDTSHTLLLFTCVMCERCFRTKDKFEQHSCVPSARRPYECAVCHKSLGCISNLQEHCRLQAGHHPFTCSVCNQILSDSFSLTRHERSHSVQRRFSCNYCGKCFSENWHLMRHERIHTGDRPYSCVVCNRKFAEQALLEAHRKRHYSVDSAEPESDSDRPHRPKKAPADVVVGPDVNEMMETVVKREPRALDTSGADGTAFELTLTLPVKDEVKDEDGHNAVGIGIGVPEPSGRIELQFGEHMVDDGKRLFPCVSCDRNFPDRQSVAKHTCAPRRRHSTSVCEVCKVNFGCPSNLLVHYKSHPGHRSHPAYPCLIVPSDSCE